MTIDNRSGLLCVNEHNSVLTCSSQNLFDLNT